MVSNLGTPSRIVKWLLVSLAARIHVRTRRDRTCRTQGPSRHGCCTMRKKTLSSVFSLLVLCVALRADAQYADAQVAAGTRIRVTGPAVGADPLIATSVSLTRDSLIVSVADGRATMRFPTSRVTSLEVSQGHDRMRWAIGGAIVGALIGFIATPNKDQFEVMPMIVGIAGGLFAIPVGAIVAPERWEPVSLGSAP
jgi:hypothetical protein